MILNDRLFTVRTSTSGKFYVQGRKEDVLSKLRSICDDKSRPDEERIKAGLCHYITFNYGKEIAPKEVLERLDANL